MIKVQRYMVCGEDCVEITSSDGHYVKYEDYENLLNYLKEIEEDNAQLGYSIADYNDEFLPRLKSLTGGIEVDLDAVLSADDD